MNSTFKTVILWVTLVAVAVVLWRMIQGGPNSGKDQEITYTQFMSELNRAMLPMSRLKAMWPAASFAMAACITLVVPANNPEPAEGA